MKAIRNIYKFLRSVVFTAVMTAVGIYVLLYVAISLPWVQDQIRVIGVRELSKLLGTEVTIGTVWISPGGEVRLDDVRIPTPEGDDCVSVTRIGAGIDLTDLIFRREIVISYGEIIGLNGHLVQKGRNSPWNIQFIINALSTKDKNKPPTPFDMRLRNIVIRSSNICIDKEWIPRKGRNLFDANHIHLENLRADISLPRIKNDDFTVDVKRLSVKESSGLILTKFTASVHITPENLNISNLTIQFPGTTLSPGDFAFEYDGYEGIVPELKRHRYSLHFADMRITPSDFAPFLPRLSNLTSPLFLTLDANGSIDNVVIDHLRLNGPDYGLNLYLKGSAGGLTNISDASAQIRNISLSASPKAIATVLTFLPKVSDKVSDIFSRMNGLQLEAEGTYRRDRMSAAGALKTGVGSLSFDGIYQPGCNGSGTLDAKLSTPDLNLGELLAHPQVGNLDFAAEAVVTLQNGGVDGSAQLELRHAELNGHAINNLLAKATKQGKEVQGSLSISDTFAHLSAEGSATIDGKNSRIAASANIDYLNPGATGLLPKWNGYTLTGVLEADMAGIDPASFTGHLILSDIELTTPKGPLHVGDVSVAAENDSDEGEIHRHISLESEFADAYVDGHFDVSQLPGAVSAMLSQSVAILADRLPVTNSYAGQDLDFTIRIKKENALLDYLNLPVKPLVDGMVTGWFHGSDGDALLEVSIPYLQQGRDKLVRNSQLLFTMRGHDRDSNLEIATKLPGKDDTEVDVALKVTSHGGDMHASALWDLNRVKKYRGEVSMDLNMQSGDAGDNAFTLTLQPSKFQVADTTWHVGAGSVRYADGNLRVRDVKVWHRNQHVFIHGDASTDPDDRIVVDLSDIDLDYVFETLNINYVTFGGHATGQAVASNIFDFRHLDAHTEGLKVKGLTYNGALLGDADLSGRFDPSEMKVGIGAEIEDHGRHCASIQGGVWVTRDSLAFDMKTDKVNIKFLQPFVSAFSSDINGRASGHVNLFGTFSDIDLTGRVYADTLNMKVDYTNVYYSGSDSVIMTPGHIMIPDFRIYDRYGNSGKLTGEVCHKYFHDPTFDFKISEARNLLCYNTDEKINPDWYGTIYGNGGGTLTGRPGYVGIMVDMAIAPRSVFNFVLNDTEAAGLYEFLTFSDHQSELREELRLREEAAADTVPDFVKMFRKKRQAAQVQNRPSVFGLDIRATVTPEAEMVLVMDPVAGDKIRAHGSGAMQIGYSSDSEEMTMYGKYTLDDGQYNFSLQDLILKDFTIREGSSISFNGDPLKAILDINAIYRVNTNLADLDKSFSTDRELNRTNVPVDAVLSVKGDLQSPDISFDIELPTLTQDMARKVKSIISTDDMMSRQIIYLLALNRFYTPEYMGSSSNGGEWASMASATVTSQLTNMLSQLTDKFTLSPSLRTDKGDFSDMEVDVALSSRLLNSRLLLNGNFGYRDRSTSNTTFVGDFDIEYLLNKSGNLRLKAYNHYNDQNYYLKSALTTQGLGVVYRKDFENLFNFMKRKRKHLVTPADTVKDR